MIALLSVKKSTCRKNHGKNQITNGVKTFLPESSPRNIVSPYEHVYGRCKFKSNQITRPFVLFGCIPEINFYDTLDFCPQAASKNPDSKEAKSSSSSSSSRKGGSGCDFYLRNQAERGANSAKKGASNQESGISNQVFR
jgi:hypothetical protein